MRAIGYLRVSTDRQAEHGLGLSVQETAVKKWARDNAHGLVQMTRDKGVSGSNGLDKREGLLVAMSALQDNLADGLVVYRLDRLARDLIIQESLLAEVWRMGKRVWSTFPSEDDYLDPDSLETDPSRTMIRQILGAVSQYEKSMIRLRLRAGKAKKAEQGGYLGGNVPFGYRKHGDKLVPDSAELETRQRILELRRQVIHDRPLPLRTIAAMLEEEGRRPKRAAHWSAEAIRKIIETG